MSNGTDQAAQLSPLKRAFLAIEELQSRLEASERARHEPIALIGIGCRLPGGVTNPEALWQLLHDGVDAIDDIPADRWDVEGLFHPDPNTPGKMSQRQGGFLRDVDRFDPLFFGIAPREAAAMDPQQRLLLEVTWEALERAGVAPAKLAGSRTGVFVAMTTGDYRDVHLSSRGLVGLDAYFASGIAHSIASGRISYVLGLEGPSLTIDTACSSSLVAIHLAIQSLRSGESRMALAGGVNLILSPENSITLSKYQMLAPDARCKFGDARADGFVRGEGCAMVALKRLSDALADGDPVLAILRGSAINQDGASSGLTAPNGPSQEAVVRAALADGRVSPAEVSYVEAHGTGTALGDPIEIQALGAVFGPEREPERPLVVGSLKTNLGHLEAVAGVASLIKLVLMVQHRAIPASLHFETPSPHIPWDELPIRIPTAFEAWNPVGRRIAGVSSFGFSGTNVHIIVEAAATQEPTLAATERPRHILTLSAKSKPALHDLAASYAHVLSATPNLADIAFTANSGRNHFAHRLALVAADSNSAAAALAAFNHGDTASGLVAWHAERADPPRVAFLFTGQGAQYAGMGRELYQHQPVFRDSLDRCAAILANYLDRPLLELLFAEPESETAAALNQTRYTQPAIVALQVALAELWRSWGVEPAALLGHSVGEYAAAIVAGVLSLEDGLALVATRGRLMGQLPTGGAMAAIFAAAEIVERALAPYNGAVVIAAYNGPEHTVIAGAEPAILAIVERFTAAGTRAQPLNVSHAFHSPLLDPMLEQLEHAAAARPLNLPRMRLLSNLTGNAVGAEIATPAYWRRHAREAVRFSDGVEQLVQLGCELLVEIGPHPTLIGLAQAILPPEAVLGLPSLRKGRDEWLTILGSLASAYTRGANINWDGFDQGYSRHRLVLPTYPFQRDRYWITAAPALRRSAGGEHPLLGRRLRSALQQAQFEQEIGHGMLSYLDDHQVFETTILPAAAFAELALAAAKAGRQHETAALADLLIHTPLVVEPGELRALHTVVTPSAAGATIEVFSQANVDEAWTLHASATAPHPPQSPASSDFTLTELRRRCSDEADVVQHYHNLRQHGLALGPSLQALRRAWRGAGEALGEIALSVDESAEAGRYTLHPALLDACLQLVAVALPDVGETYLPIAFDRLQIYGRASSQAVAHVSLQSSDSATSRRETIAGDIQLFDEDGRLLATLDGLLLKRADQHALRRARHDTPDDWLYNIAWRPSMLEVPKLLDAAFLLAPAVVSTAVEARVDTLDAELNLNHYRNLLPALEALATDYIASALRELGWRPAVGERFTSIELADRLGVISAQQALFNRLLSLLSDDGILRATSGAWEVVRAPHAVETHGRAETLMMRFPAARGDIEITRRCGEKLADALRGAADPLQLLFPGGSLTTAEELYRISPLARAYTSLLAEAVTTAIKQLPAARQLRVLEIGAGTGGATSALLPALNPAQTSYTFTDISPLFLARARESFAAYPFVEYRTLDIETDPLAQGFNPHSFDVIVAANVVHATTDLRHSLANMRQLLAPSGLLMLLEMTAPMRWIDISFGLTSGWWRFSDYDLRPNYVLLERDAWLDLFGSTGFSNAEAFPNQDNSAGLNYQQIVIGRGPGEVQASEILPADLRSLLIFADASGVGEQLAQLVTQRGGKPTVITAGSAFACIAPDRYQLAPHDREGFERLLREYSSADAAVYLWGLDTPTLAERADTPVAAQAPAINGMLHLAQALLRSNGDPRLWLASNGGQAAGGIVVEPAQATLWGLGKSLALEHPELRITRIDLDPTRDAHTTAMLLTEMLHGAEPEVALRGTERLVARLTRSSIGAGNRAAATEEQPVELVITERGALDNIALRPTARRAPGAGEVEVRVAATALNFKDVLNVLGMYPGDPGQPGSECAGTVVAVGAGVSDFHIGDEVVALASGSFRSYTTVRTELVAHRPPSLSVEQAITLPIAYLTAAFALQSLGKMQPGERVLIHAAAGGVGLAAVRLAQRAGVKVYATAGSTAKHEYLRALGVEHIFDSRSLSFAEGVRAATGGEGVDLVLNSLAGAFVPRSLELLREGGRFLELGKRDHLTAEQAANLERNISYHVIDWSDQAREQPELIGSMLREIMHGAARGDVPPLPFRSFPLEQTAAAFRYMAQARHIGKIIVTQSAASRGSNIRADASYLITGGLSGLGLLSAQWLVECGARHLALVGRSSANAAAQTAIAKMEQAGATILAIRGDVSQATDVAAVLARIAAELPPLRGVIHSAGVLDDGALSQQSWPRFERVMAPKVDGAAHLHKQTAASELDFFVLYSSAASLLGSAGQTNHSAANSFLDALAQRRHAEGLPALSINWGAWSEVGAAVSSGAVDRIGAHGLEEIAPERGLALLGRMLEAAPPQVGVVPINWPVFLARFAGGASPVFAEFATTTRPVEYEQKAPESQAPDIVRKLAEATPQRRMALLRDFVRDTAGHVLALPVARISDETPLSALGLDSLMAVELRNLLGAGLNVPRRLPATLVFDYPTISAMTDYLASETLDFGAQEDDTADVVVAPSLDSGAVATMIDTLEDLSDDEIDRLLAEKLRG